MAKPGPKGPPNKRPKTGGAYSRDDIDWDLAEQWYVQGDIVEEKGRGGEKELIRKKVTYKDVARRFRCSHSLVAYHAKRRKWREKQHKFQDMQNAEIRDALAKSRARTLGEGLAILDRWLTMFEQDLEAGKVRTDSISDLNTAMRLKAFIESQGSDGADNSTAEVTLDDLQRAHREQRRKSEAIEPGTTGVIADESKLH